MPNGQIKATIKYKYFQSIDTIEYLYIFSFSEKNHSKPKNFRIQYLNLDIDILINKKNNIS